MPSLADAKLAYYNSKGYFGSLSDCELAFFSAGGSGGSGSSQQPGELIVGESVYSRMIPRVALPLTSGTIKFTCFTATKTETINTVIAECSAVAAPTPGLCKVGIYQIDVSNDMTLVASSGNNTAMFNAGQRRTIPLSASFSKVSGTTYAIGILLVSAAGTPSLFSLTVNGFANGNFPMGFSVIGLADLPATILAGDRIVGDNPNMIYFELLP